MSDMQRPETDVCWTFTGVQELEQQTRNVEEGCGPYEAIVRTKMTGLCGSDVHIYSTGLIRGEPFQKPFILGHESSGVVEKVGEMVRGLSVGTRVALEPGEGCLRCEHCKSGHYAHCDNMKFAAALGRDGTLRRFYRLPADLCYPLPESMSFEEGAMIEPLSVAVQAVVNIAMMRSGDRVAIFGAGPVGVLTVAVVKALGGQGILAVDINKERLDFLKHYAGIDTHLASMASPEERAQASHREAQAILEVSAATKQKPFDLVIECSGAESSIQTGVLILKKRGTFVQVGNCGTMTSLPMLTVVNRQLTIKGSFRYGPGCYQKAIDLVQSGLIDLKPLTTHTFDWNDAVEAFESTRRAKGPDGKSAIKVLIKGPE